eukprot:TRINITY_DN4169_c0_g3_i1.p1 TRINITY_DN4169_c0_g3~~TRINITY_DN4169_c0_g3_i1.p1  ORF type:complete len:361 (-),score=87.19 TRINITY_DN4169_c0_g3_i1:22-1104(-)
MDKIKAEIERKKRQAEEAKGSLNNPSKWVKRGDIEREMEKKIREERLKEQQKQQEEEQRLLEEKKKIEQEKAESSTSKEAGTSLKHSGSEMRDPIPPIPRGLVMNRLRERAEPVTLFGETDWLRYQRLRILEEADPREYTSNGSANDFQMSIREMMKNANTELEEQNAPIDATKEKKPNVAETVRNVEEAMEKAKETNERETYILLTLRRLLHIWERDLDERPQSEKLTAQGMTAVATYQQCYKDIKPLFKLLRKKTLPEDMVEHLFDISLNTNLREYVKANDSYLRLSIGNAAWPMGVTMVGIHERSSREKIFSKQVAHVLNDETQRKYIQSVKRLVTFAQEKFVAEPSKCVKKKKTLY